MIEWLNNLHPNVNALVVVLGTTTALLTLAAAVRSCWRAIRRLFPSRDARKDEQWREEKKPLKPWLRKKPAGESGFLNPIGSNFVGEFKDNIEKLAQEQNRPGKVVHFSTPMGSDSITPMRAAWERLNVTPGKHDDAMDALAYSTEAQAHASEEWIRNPLLVLDSVTGLSRRATNKEIQEYEKRKQQKANERAASDFREAELRRSAMKRNIQKAMAKHPLKIRRNITLSECLSPGQVEEVKKLVSVSRDEPGSVSRKRGTDGSGKPWGSKCFHCGISYSSSIDSGYCPGCWDRLTINRS